jgi:LemA protein
MTMFFGVVSGLLVALLLYTITVYNGLVRLKTALSNSFAQIDVQMKRRYDLIPNLVETAKAYMKHERETLEAVIAARNQGLAAMRMLSQNPADAAQIGKLAQAESQLRGGLQSLSVVMESYPDLKANTTMLQMMEELTSTENKISFARQAFNDAVMEYNTARQVFPSNIVAGLFNFTAAQSFEIENPREREAVAVKF